MKSGLIWYFAIAIALSYCSCSSRANMNAESNEPLSEGWIDNNTYRISAGGTASNIQDFSEKKSSAEKSAIKKAQFKLIKKFNLLELNDSDINNNPTTFALGRELKMIVLSGKVIEKNYNEKNEVCEIIYEIKSKGLKQKVEAAQ